MTKNTDKNSNAIRAGAQLQSEQLPTDTNQPHTTEKAVNNTEGIKFSPGEIVATTNAMSQVSGAEIARGLSLHLCGDWGTVCKEDWEVNNEALEVGDRLVSSYLTPDGVKFWIITEWDRSYTTVLLPDDY